MALLFIYLFTHFLRQERFQRKSGVQSEEYWYQNPTQFQSSATKMKFKIQEENNYSKVTNQQKSKDCMQNRRRSSLQ